MLALSRMADQGGMNSETAVIDANSAGRLDVGFARAYLPSEFATFEVPMDRLLIAEVLELVAEAFEALLSTLPGSGHLHQALTAGAAGYLVKAATGDRLIDAIKSVAAGGIVIDPQLAADALCSGPNPLSEREQTILRFVDQGLNTRAIAAELFLSHGTVRNYLSTIMTKLDARSRVEAVRTAHRRGWL